MLFVGVRESRSQPINLVVCHDGALALYSTVNLGAFQSEGHEPFTGFSVRQPSPPAALQAFANWNWGCTPS